MKTMLLTAFFTAAIFTLFGQSYSFPFEGKVSNYELFDQQLQMIEGIASVKVLLKEDSNSGELIVELDATPQTGDGHKNLDTFIQLKRIILENGLNPKEFVELKN